MATKKTGMKIKRSWTGNDKGFRPIDAKREALEAAERQARRKPTRMVRVRSRASSSEQTQPAKNGLRSAAKKSAKKAAGRKSAANAKSAAGKGSTGKRIDESRLAPAEKASAKQTAVKKASAKKASAKRVSAKLWKLAERKAAQKTHTPAWQQIEHHDHRAQTNAPHAQRARFATVKRGDRRLTPAEKQRPGE